MKPEFTDKEIIAMQSRALQEYADEVERRKLGADTEELMSKIAQMEKEIPILRGTNLVLARDVDFYEKRMNEWQDKYLEATKDLNLAITEVKRRGDDVTMWIDTCGFMQTSLRKWRLVALINMGLLVVNAVFQIIMRVS